MADFNLNTEFSASVTLHQAGQPEQASRGYRRVLAAVPDQPTVQGYLGMALAQVGHHAIAATHLHRSLALSHEDAAVHNNLGNALALLGRENEAILAYRKAAVLAPAYSEPHYGLAITGTGRRRNLATLLRTVVCDPGHIRALLSLAQIDTRRVDLSKAPYWLRRALSLSPENPFAHAIAANTWLAARRPDLARDAALRASGAGGELATLHNLLAQACEGMNDPDGARRRYRQCLTLDPSHAHGLVGSGSLELTLGHPARAALLFGRALARAPADDVAYGNLLFSSAFLEQPHSQAPTRLSHRWAAARATFVVSSHSNPSRQQPKRLRIAYISPEFVKHSFLSQLLPVLECHDRNRFEVFAYGQAAARDASTDRVRERVDVWRPIAGLDLEAQAATVRADGIDVAVNLTGYLAHHRLLFARRIARVHIAYINHVAPTGLSSIDARITDSWLEPEGAPFVDVDEALIRMSTGFSCLSPPVGAPDPLAQPASSNGYVTFGVVNNLAKISWRSLDAWSRILARLPSARIVIKATGLSSKTSRDEIIGALGRSGVAADRVTLVGRIATDEDNLRLIGRMDIALDPFPFNGGLSTGDALWMGVPVVSLCGNQFVGRLGLSLLHRAGFPDWVTSTADAYVDRAVELASDIGKLGALRKEMRNRLRRSVLFDAIGHTRELERAYIGLWQALAGRMS